MTSLEKLGLEAKKAGVPQDQLVLFLNAGYVPLPWSLRFHAAARLCDLSNGPVEVAAGGARGPGKSHTCFAQAAIDDCQRFPGLKVLFLRKTAVSAKESFGDLIDKVIRGRVSFTPAGNVLTFTNGSRIILGGFHDANDIDKYIGIEYDVIVLEEANQLTEDKLDKLKGSLRTSKPGWRPRMYLSFNPGGIGHGFVKKRYVTPHRKGQETITRYIPSTYKDNPFLNTEYIQYLESLSGNLGKAWREGNFDIFEGQYFSDWNYDFNTIEPFEIPREWKRYRALDHGSAKPTSCGWYAIDLDGVLYRYREYYAIDKLASNHAKRIKELSKGEDIVYTAADPSMWIKSATDGKSAQEIYMEEGVPLVKANNDRINGWAVVREYLSYVSGQPRLRIFRTCHNLIRTLPEMIHDELHPEDLNTDLEDHAVDELRYMTISRSYPHHPKVEEPPPGSFLWTIQEQRRKREYEADVI